MIRVAMAAALLGGVSLPALALDAPAPADKRLRSVVYSPNQVVPFYTAPGATARIQLGAGEKVTGVLVSDQVMLGGEPDDSAPEHDQGGKAPSGPTVPSCDRNICRSVIGNFVYVKPLRELDPQPLFIQTDFCDETAKCEAVPYALEIVTRKSDMAARVAYTEEQTQNAYYGLAFMHPARDAAARRRAAAEAGRKWRAMRAEEEERRAMAPLPVSYVQPQQGLQWRHAWQGAAELMPDAVWDDGRNTFLRFNGMRRVPNVYTRNPDGTKALAQFAAEPGPTGTVLRIGKTAFVLFLEDGGHLGALYNAGPDPEGRGSLTVAAPTAPFVSLSPGAGGAGPLRVVARPQAGR